MPSGQEEDGDIKLILLEEQLVKLDINLLRNTNSNGGDQNKDLDQINMMIKQRKDCDQDNMKHANEMLITDETSSKLHTDVMDNKESYKSNQSADTRGDTEKSLTKAESEKHKVEVILNEIFKKEPHFIKEILNYLTQRLDSKAQIQFLCNLNKESTNSWKGSLREEANSLSHGVSLNKEATDTLNESLRETKSVSHGVPLDKEVTDSLNRSSREASSKSNGVLSDKEVTGSLNERFSKKPISMPYSKNDAIEEEITFVKEAFATENTVAFHCNKHSISYESSSFGDQELHTQTMEKNSHTPNSLETKFGQTVKHDCNQFSNCSKNISELMENADATSAKQAIDMMEKEKVETNNFVEDSVNHEDVTEIHDAEGSEECPPKMGNAECCDPSSVNLHPVSLTQISNTSWNVSKATCFMPSLAESVWIENFSLKPIYSLDSFISKVENRLSLELLVPRNVCYYCNITASRQTNTSCISVLDDTDQTETKQHSQNEDVIFHAEKKVCNLAPYQDSFGLNACNISLSKKYVSKGVIAMMNVCGSDSIDSESEHSVQDILNDSTAQYKLEFENSLSMTWDSIQCSQFVTNCNEISSMEPISSAKRMQREEVDNHLEDEALQINKIDLKCTQEGETKVSSEDMRDIDDSLVKNYFVKTDSEGICRHSEDNVISFLDKGQRKVKKTFKGMKDYKRKDKDEHRDIRGDKMKNSIGKRKYQQKRTGNKEFQERNVENKSGKLKNPEDRQMDSSKQSIHKRQNCDRGGQSHTPYLPLKVGGETVDKGCGGDKLVAKLDQDKEQENCLRNNLTSGFSQKLDPNTAKKKEDKRKKRCSAKNKSKKNKMFDDKSGPNMDNDTFVPNKTNRNGDKNKQKQRKHKQFPSNQTGDDVSFSDRDGEFYLKNDVSLKKHSNKHFNHGRGNSFHLDGDPPVRLHLVKAKVCSRSGGDNSNGSSGKGSTSGMQGNGNQSSDRGAGSGRQNSNGSGSSSGDDGDKDNNNHNNNDLRTKSSLLKGASKKKRNKSEKDGGDNSEHNIQRSRELGRRVTGASSTSPSLPTPQLDPEHIAERLTVEKARQIQNPNTIAVVPATPALTSGQNEELEASAIPGTALGLLPDNEVEAPDIQHAVVSIFQLCDTIGESTHGLPVNTDVFKQINLCLTRLIHDLTLAADEDNNRVSYDNCSVCLVLSQLLIHQANPGHDGLMRSCDQCAQIFNLIMQHCIGCIQSNRSRSRHTHSDLCYKICKYLHWDVEQLNQSLNKLKGKVLKYCDKVLGSTTDIEQLTYHQEDTSQAIGEIGIPTPTDIPSTGGSTLSFSGNIVTTETGSQEQQQQVHPEEGPTSVNLGATSLTITSGATAMPPSITPAGIIVGGETPGHTRLSRKPSQRRTLAIPQPIVEENQASEISASSFSINKDEGEKDDIENLIYRKYGEYGTQRTYGDGNQYGSLPLGHMHDGAQFYSVSTQPFGLPGIGEVVYGHPTRLGTVAKFWDKKREECEKTQTCPYQLREEGVILADQKENFSILHTRYQKHQQWERVAHLGNGMSGKCHLAIDLTTKFTFCCKKIHLLRYAEEELSLWSEMHNAYIVRLYGAIRHGVKIYIFSEFIDGGSLAACIEEQKRLGRRLSHWSAINYFQQLLKVLFFLQKKNILHEDIKADNILLRRNSTFLAVTDFGTSRRLQDPKELKNKSPVGSPTHWSPEKASMEGHGFPSDLWAAVCVLVHMLSGEPPWLKRFKKAGMLNFIIYMRSPPMEDVPDNVQLVVRDLIERGYAKDPQVRPSCSELLQHQAFRILDEGTPETYFSTLASMAPSGLHAIRIADTTANEQSPNNEEVPPNALNSVEATVLFETNVNNGPYQESDSRPDNMNHHSYASLFRASNQNASAQSVNVSQTEAPSTGAAGNQPRMVEGNAGVASGRTSQILHTNATNAPIEDTKTVSPSKTANQLVEPFDINKLLPQFDDLFVSGDDINTQSIKDFFIDNYTARDLSDVRQPSLQVYKPEERTDELPNLSIFNDTHEATAHLNDTTTIPMQDIKKRFPVSMSSPSQTPTNFILSSGSEDCTSADLFDFDPAAKTFAVVQNTSNNLDAQAINETSNPQRHSVFPPGDVGLTVSTGSNPGSLGTSNLQQRKPTNLTLNVTATPQPSGLSHSHSDSQVSSAHVIEQKNRSNTWTQLPLAAQASYHTGNTPISSHSASALGRTGATSVPSTASSGSSHFHLQSSVVEEQIRMLQELASEMNQFSPTRSVSSISFTEDYPSQDPADNNEAVEYEQSHSTMLREIGETQLGGHHLKFYDEINEHIFTMRIETPQQNWKLLIQKVRQMISSNEYTHFRVCYMDSTPVKNYSPLRAYDFKVVKQNPGPDCWCQRCNPMY